VLDDAEAGLGGARIQATAAAQQLQHWEIVGHDRHGVTVDARLQGMLGASGEHGGGDPAAVPNVDDPDGEVGDQGVSGCRM
jgi:hypothetical protein